MCHKYDYIDTSPVRGSFWSGGARCSDCGHRWWSVVEVDVSHMEPRVLLECPNCHAKAGAPTYRFFTADN